MVRGERVTDPGITGAWAMPGDPGLKRWVCFRYGWLI